MDEKYRGRWRMHLDQLDTVLRLVIKLTDNFISASQECNFEHFKSLADLKKELLSERQQHLLERLVEACDLKANIEGKGQQLIEKVTNNGCLYNRMVLLFESRVVYALFSYNNNNNINNNKNVNSISNNSINTIYCSYTNNINNNASNINQNDGNINSSTNINNISMVTSL
ncbi:hypothetical protein HELRODRAFT_176777 [Helobdella robusta]|uniref:Uncharacterized protein n=1 Tax=Helobdella robusta TaxID=6412 RepID=T1FAW6_HELRO|nr:hypothetical protein HELRODRAFT_176777 [Helobdella robusta]ESN99611.1 hypothetical protein HELRODRAFT_176777 [Helobdella robusta]